LSVTDHSRQVVSFLLAVCTAGIAAAVAAGACDGFAARAVDGHDSESLKPFVMLVSIDGLKPEAVLDAAHHGLKVPNLRALMTDGLYSTGVHGVLPTLTYPSHMTLMTGASPARHGIYSNTTFDPFNRNERGWYWYAEDVRVATLWAAAAAAHLTTANVYWPTSVGARVNWNLPQIWRTGTDDDLKLQRALSTPGLEQELSRALGRYPGGMEETVAEDTVRARFAMRLIESKHPDFITIYLTGLDTEQHRSGPFSTAANGVLEQIDGVVGRLRAAADAAAPGRAIFCVVSDHGFAPVEHDLNLFAAFRAAGLFTVDSDHKITGWRAMPWPAGGMAAVMLADGADDAVRTQVGELLKTLAADPANGIERILPRDAVVGTRGFPDAEYLVQLKIGYEIGLAFELPLVSVPSNLGMHGYSPDRPEMRSAFFLVGPSLPRAHSVGEIDMRQIAPTLAKILGVSLPDAELGPLPLH
jgi:predicted AlkP superfamily pyrophosphatase or phosphodiesterase